MSLLDRVRECNVHDLTHFVPFIVAGVRVGWVKKWFIEQLRAFPHVFDVTERAVEMSPRLTTPEERTEAAKGALRALADAGIIKGWRDEYYPVGTSFTAPPLMLMERAAVVFFGVRAYGIHVNGVVRDGGETKMWIGRRAPDKHTYPDQLDNLIGGGQPAGIGLMDNLVKEAEEEASIPPELAATAVPVGAVSYCLEAEEGLRPDVLFCYDLELPPDFVPVNRDGEVAEFQLWPVEHVLEIVAQTTEFKFNCNLIVIDFAVRHGFLAPDEPDYIDIVQGLRR
ncbi:MAG TPA: DUF4743 domain-containing protein [Alphaproteobacteria bacterium]